MHVPRFRRSFICPAFLSAAWALAPALPAWQSSLVSVSPGGEISYAADETGNRIPDFSHAGYHGGGVPLPEVPVVKTLAPEPGDNTARIQAAIGEVSALPEQADGYRGALLLGPGVFEVSDTLNITAAGVVLLGSGQDDDPATGTIIRRTGTSVKPVISAGGASVRIFPQQTRTVTAITTARVAAGSRSFEVAGASGFAVGDAVVLRRPVTEAWLESVNHGDTFPGLIPARTAVWGLSNGFDLRYHRYITAINGNTVTLDAPVFDNLDRAIAECNMGKFDATGMSRHIGIANLQIDIVTESATSENHANNGIDLQYAENCWVRHVTVKHCWQAGVRIGPGCTRVSVESSRVGEPRGLPTGGRFSGFATDGAQLILFRDCYAGDSRHAFVCNGSSRDSGIVFLDCVSERPIASSEGHRNWIQGILFDNLTVRDPRTKYTLGLYNRGNYGTAHGWAAVHSVAWGCSAEGSSILIQRPPGAQNYGIGCLGDVTGEGPFKFPGGHIEGANRPGLEPRSLYLAQLRARTAPPVAPVPPKNANITAGQPGARVTFEALAQGAPAAACQWQLSTDGGATWRPLADDASHDGAATATLAITRAAAAMNGWQYRYTLTAGQDAGFISAPATLTVAPDRFPMPAGLALDTAGALYIADAQTHTIQKITPARTIEPLAGLNNTPGAINGAGAAARFSRPHGLKINPADGSIHVADTGNGVIRRLTASGEVTLLSAALPMLAGPTALAIDNQGNTYIADTDRHLIRKVTPGGHASIIAGDGLPGMADATGTRASFNRPAGIAVDADGWLYVADTGNHAIRVIAPETHDVALLAGLPGEAGCADGAPAAARFRAPGGLAIDGLLNSGNRDGSLYIADTGNSLIREITAGAVATIAGCPGSDTPPAIAGIPGYRDGAGTAAWFDAPADIALAANGNLYVADTGNAAIRKITFNPAGEAEIVTLTAAAASPAPPPGADAGGGGGAPAGWFLLALALLTGMRTHGEA